VNPGRGMTSVKNLTTHPRINSAQRSTRDLWIGGNTQTPPDPEHASAPCPLGERGRSVDAGTVLLSVEPPRLDMSHELDKSVDRENRTGRGACQHLSARASAIWPTCCPNAARKSPLTWPIPDGRRSRHSPGHTRCYRWAATIRRTPWPAARPTRPDRSRARSTGNPRSPVMGRCA